MQSNPIPPFSQMEYDYCNINWVFVKILVGLVVNQPPPPLTHFQVRCYVPVNHSEMVFFCISRPYPSFLTNHCLIST